MEKNTDFNHYVNHFHKSNMAQYLTAEEIKKREEAEKLVSFKVVGTAIGNDVYANVTSIIEDLDLSKLKEVADLDLAGFGLMNSHEYRKKLAQIFVDEGLDTMDQLLIFVLTVKVKNKARILGAINKFNQEPWYKTVRDFFAKNTTQFAPDAAGKKLMPVVDIPGANPSLAALAFALTNLKSTGSGLLENLWSAQLKLDENTLKKQYAWEKDFWNYTVTTSSNPDKKRYNPGFHAKFWSNKSEDVYPLIVPGTHDIFSVKSYTGDGYTEKDLDDYLSMVRTIVNDPGKLAVYVTNKPLSTAATRNDWEGGSGSDKKRADGSAYKEFKHTDIQKEFAAFIADTEAALNKTLSSKEKGKAKSDFTIWVNKELATGPAAPGAPFVWPDHTHIKV